ncbi:polysaccharide biosynthesis/export family protein [Neiella sp. HB171785]|uniref:Polysaccharide biosynthesis/export family protein n=1 Tax=Neiella litorisoli TaxID=2771431 RepID=A0A8J6QID0_9GAMM|nr:XrtA/PEP-CTERM system exopolysaccharide export protein [Neiella litorisoli]MBD1390530.1 polysaccharide biosynthesis/export family protein [Neiella litorisoli]
MKNKFLLKAVGLMAALFAVSTIGGCATSDKGQLPPATTHPSLTTNIDDYFYLIGPGDSLNVFVWRNPEVTGTFTVRPDGMFTTRLVEDIPATGRTPTQLARELEKILGAYIRDPIVTVTVGGFVGPYSEQVRVIGEALNPQAINYKENMTLLDLMIAVGGLTDYANGDDTTLIRIENGVQREYTLKLDTLIRDGDIGANVDILPGDILIIPEAWF